MMSVTGEILLEGKYDGSCVMLGRKSGQGRDEEVT